LWRLNAATRPHAFRLHAFSFTVRLRISRQRRGQQTAFLARSDAQSTCGKAPPSSMSCREAAAPWLIRYGVAHLLSCAATSMIDRGRRLTDEAFRTRFGKLSAGSSGCLFHVFAPVALRSFAAGLKSARPSVSGRFLQEP
jgi:hypothetical protein